MALSLAAVAVLRLVGCGAGSAIDSCLDSGGSYDSQFGECDPQNNHPGPNSSCLHQLPGAWVVSGHLSPGLSAMSEEEANAWDGEVISLSKKGFAFRELVCAHPMFNTREIPRPQFQEEFRVSWEALDLVNKPVCVTEVSCEGLSPFPGSLLIHGKDHLLVLWDGVYFKAHRQ